MLANKDNTREHCYLLIYLNIKVYLCLKNLNALVFVYFKSISEISYQDLSAQRKNFFLDALDLF